MKKMDGVMTNRQTDETVGAIEIIATQQERERLHALATRYAQIADMEIMNTRKRQWRALNDLKPEKPMILIETFTLIDFLTQEEIQCQNDFLRNVERTLLYAIKQFELFDDDLVIEKYFRLPWRIVRSDYGDGIRIVETHAEDSMGYMSNHPVQTIDDLQRLKPRSFYVDRERTLGLKQLLEDIFGDVLPVRVGNYDIFYQDMGFNPFVGNMAPLTTMDLFKLMGNDNLLLWPYDHPAELKVFMEYLHQDKMQFIKWATQEKLLVPNTDNQFASPSGYGYVSELPENGVQEMATPQDCWVWVESQECMIYSPEMYDEVILPYLAEYSNQFGLISYGCCEPLEDRIEYIKRAMPKLRSVSVSGWSNFEKMAQALGGGNYVYLRKPSPMVIGGREPDWKGVTNDITRTWDCAKELPLAMIYRDVYDLNHDFSRIQKWIETAKRIMGL